MIVQHRLFALTMLKHLTCSMEHGPPLQNIIHTQLTGIPGIEMHGEIYRSKKKKVLQVNSNEQKTVVLMSKQYIYGISFKKQILAMFVTSQKFPPPTSCALLCYFTHQLIEWKGLKMIIRWSITEELTCWTAKNTSVLPVPLPHRGSFKRACSCSSLSLFCPSCTAMMSDTL